MKRINAPELDFLLRVYDDKSYNPRSYDAKVKKKLIKLYDLLDMVKSIEGGDDLKILYFSVNRGTIKDYGDYEELKAEGEVDNYEEFRQMFEYDYPNEECWYRLVTSRYNEYLALSINYKGIIYAKMDDEDSAFEDRQLQQLLDFLIFKVTECIDMLKNNTYNDYVSTNLAYTKRFGVIKRSDYWQIFPDVKKSLLAAISQEEIDYFVKNASDNTTERIKDMTSGKYFECVRLAYQNNDYDIGSLNDKELYSKYADGRDEGLRNIDSNSPKEFAEWYNDKNRFGGHPWEIMRGHSFYRVNMPVYHDDNGYYLGLDGSIILRNIEIAKIYIVLKEHNYPLSIYNVDIIKDSLTGNDYIGIVPDTMMPIYCDSCFEKYKPREFIHLNDEIFDYVLWQDIEKAELVKDNKK